MAGEKGSTYANNILQLIFNATSITGLAQNNATSPLTSLYISLHTSDAGAGGSQTTNEVTTGEYTGYARAGVARTSSGFTVTGNSVSPTSAISFPACTGGTGATITYFAIGTASTGTGEILYSGPLSPTIAVANGVTPQIATATAITEV